MATRCPVCAGTLYDSTGEASFLERGRSVSCLSCARIWFERTATPAQEWAPARPGRPRRLPTRRPVGNLS